MPPEMLPTREVWKRVLWILVLNRLALFFFMWVVMQMIPPTGPPGGVALGHRPNASNLLLDGWFRWDVHWYSLIAQNGYTNTGSYGQRDVVFFPFFPLLVRVASWLTGNVYTAGLVAAHLALAGACFFLFRLAERHVGAPQATRAVSLLLIYPFSFILSAPYTEATFLAAVTGAFYFAEEGRWVAAGIAASCAGTTRVAGWFVLVGLAVLYLEQRRYRLREIRWNVLGIAVGAIGPALHLAWLQRRFGDPLVFLKGQNVPGWGEAHNLQQVAALFEHATWHQVIHGDFDVGGFFQVAVFCVGLAASAWCLVKVRAGYGVWALLYVLVSLERWANMGRFAVVVFPIFLAWAYLVRSERAMVAWAVPCCLYMALLMQNFSHWHYVG